MTTQQRIYQIVSHLTEVPVADITPEMRVMEYIDSPDSVQFIMELEEGFDITIPDEEAEGIVTVGEAVRYVEERLRAAD